MYESKPRMRKQKSYSATGMSSVMMHEADSLMVAEPSSDQFAGITYRANAMAEFVIVNNM